MSIKTAATTASPHEAARGVCELTEHYAMGLETST